MNDGSEVLASISADAFPNAHDIAAGGIHDLAPAIFDVRDELGFSSESGDDDHVFWGEFVHGGIGIGPDEIADAHFDQLAVHLGVVDDLADEVDILVWKNPA